VSAAPPVSAPPELHAAPGAPRNDRRDALAAWALATLLGGLFLWRDPVGTFTPDALRVAARGVGVALAVGVSAVGAGGAMLRRWAPGALEGRAGAVQALAVGVGALGLALLPVAYASVVPWRVGAGAVLAVAALGWVARPRMAWPRLPPAAVAIGAVLLLPALVEALAPPTDTDELYYHLALPRRIAEGQGLLGGPMHPDGSRPLPVHLVHAAIYAFGGEAAPRLFHLGLVAAMVGAVYLLAEDWFGPRRGVLPALALLGSYSFLREAGLAYNDHFVALCALLAAEAALRDRPRLGALLAGFALAAKYTAAPVVLGVAVVAVGRAWRRRTDDGAFLRIVVGAAALGLAPVLPWLLRNVLEGLHPLFPYAGWPDIGRFAFVYPEKYGLGRAPTDLALLPWNLLFHARTDSFAFLGRISPLWAVLLAAGSWGAARGASADARDAARGLAWMSLVGFLGWAAGAHLLRWLLPVSGVAALLGGATRPRAAWIALWLAGAAANLAPVWERAADRVAVVAGHEPRERFLGRALPAWPALDHLRAHVPPDARVAMLFSWHGYYVSQGSVLGSVEDHVPTRWWLARHGDDALGALRRAGVTHLLVGDVGFLRASYPFLTPAELEEQFNAPERRLREQLHAQATRLFVQSRWEVWRLDTPTEPVEPAPP
jgi:hypothetical protein